MKKKSTQQMKYDQKPRPLFIRMDEKVYQALESFRDLNNFSMNVAVNEIIGKFFKRKLS